VEATGKLRARNEADERQLADFERRMSLPIFVSALLPIIFSLAGKKSIVSGIILIVTWFVFVADLVVHMRLIRRYLKSGQGIFDLVVVLLTAPWFLIPGLGDARFLALARLARLVRIIRAGRGSLRRLVSQLGQVGLVAVGLILTCAYVAYSVEHPVNKGFATFGDSVWWATVTITTVGYGDIVPTTTTGRITAVVLMFSGLGVLGVLAGSLASFFGLGQHEAAAAETAAADTATAPPAPEPASEPPGDDDNDIRARVAELRTRVAELDQALVAVQQRLR
jgi:voltage-gated potassium channel